MLRSRTWMCVLLVGLSVTGVRAQYRPAGNTPAQKPPAEIPTAGFWPTQRMVDSAIDRISDEMAKIYAFDDEQVWNTRDVLKARFPQWMEQNRAELQTLTNQYFEALLSGEPPTPEEVADWSARALPLFDQFTQMVDQTTEDMRTYMTDDQQVLLNGQLAAMQVGMNYMQQRLNTWKDGGYDWESEWPRSQEFKKRQGAREKQLQNEADRAANEAMGFPTAGGTTDAAGGTTDAAGAEGGLGAPAGKERQFAASQPKSEPKDEWTLYVENFIRRYSLDDAQQGLARKYLTSSLEERDKYLKRKLPDINTVEGKLKTAKTDDERETVRSELSKLNAPLDRYFGRLKERLDSIPTRKQRAAAALANDATRGKGELADKAKTSLKSEMESRAHEAKGEGADKAVPPPQSKPADQIPPAEK